MKRGHSTGDIAATNSANGNDNDNSFTKVRNGRKKSKRAINSSQPVQNTCPDIPASNGGDHSITSLSVSVQLELTELRKSVKELSAVVSDQKATINNLNSKLKFVLSFLDITDCEQVCGNLGAVANVNAVNAVEDVQQSAQQSSQQTTQSVTYASTAATSHHNGGSGPPSKLRHAVAAAVYADQRDKERRAKTVVVSGLVPSQVDSDEIIFQRLCMLEFGVNPTIMYARRLGAIGGGRVRPLLIGLESVDNVSAILNQAKRLRTSTDVVTRDNVYINRNLTKVEEQLAYEERCRRRTRRPATNQVGTASTSGVRRHSVGQHVGSNSVNNSGDRTEDARTTISSSSPLTSLNPSAPVFQHTNQHTQ